MRELKGNFTWEKNKGEKEKPEKSEMSDIMKVKCQMNRVKNGKNEDKTGLRKAFKMG